jgi:hypothetical protein
MEFKPEARPRQVTVAYKVDPRSNEYRCGTVTVNQDINENHEIEADGLWWRVASVYKVTEKIDPRLPDFFVLLAPLPCVPRYQ